MTADPPGGQGTRSAGGGDGESTPGPADPASTAPKVGDQPASGNTRLRLSLGALAGAVTLIVAIWGAITGTIAWTENRAISVHLSASSYSAFFRSGPGVATEAIRVSVVNTSAKAISLVQAEVLLDGEPVGQVTSVTSEGTGAGSATTPLPTSAPANSSSTIAMEWRGSPGNTLAQAVATPVAQRKLALRVNLEPGGSRVLPVRMGQIPTLIGSWYTDVLLRNDRVTAIFIGTGAISSGSVLATLQVWPADPARTTPVLVARRPAAYGVPGWYSLASLPRGGYVFDISAGERSLVTGVLQTTCIGADGVYGAGACAFGDATAYTPVHVAPPGLAH